MIDQLIDSALSVSLLILLVLALRGPVARQFGARAAYALWLAPLLRLVAPLIGAWAPLHKESIAPAIGGPMPEIIIARVPAASGSDAIFLGARSMGGRRLHLSRGAANPPSSVPSSRASERDDAKPSRRSL